MYPRPSASSSTSSSTTTTTMSSMTSGASSSVDSRSAFSLHRQRSVSNSHKRLQSEPQLSAYPTAYPTTYPNPNATAYSPAGESEDAPFLGTPFALERPYEYPFPSPDVDLSTDLSRAWTGAAAAVAAQSVLPSLSYSTSSPLAQSLLSSAKMSVEGGAGLANNNPNAAKKKEQITRENLAKRRATTGNILHPLNIPQSQAQSQYHPHLSAPPVPPTLLSREHAGQLSPILAQMSPGLALGMPSPRLFRNWRGDENGNRNDTTKRTTR